MVNSSLYQRLRFPKLLPDQEFKLKFKQKIKLSVYLKILTAIIITWGIIAISCSCALLQKSIDNRTGFSALLKQTENHIRNEEWEESRISLENSEKTWKKIKPWLQIDIDHDYVNSIESDFVKLYGYIEAKDKAESLATILLVQDMWENIGSL